MTTVPQPRVGKFRHGASSSTHAVCACVIPSAGGESHGLDLSVVQAKALSLELSRAIIEYELIALDDRDAIRLAGRPT